MEKEISSNKIHPEFLDYFDLSNTLFLKYLDYTFLYNNKEISSLQDLEKELLLNKNFNIENRIDLNNTKNTNITDNQYFIKSILKDYSEIDLRSISKLSNSSINGINNEKIDNKTINKKNYIDLNTSSDTEIINNLITHSIISNYIEAQKYNKDIDLFKNDFKKHFINKLLTSSFNDKDKNNRNTYIKRIEYYGSSEYKLNIKNSDIDLTIFSNDYKNTGNSYSLLNQINNNKEEADILESFYNNYFNNNNNNNYNTCNNIENTEFSSFIHRFTEVSYIRNTKTPIIRSKYKVNENKQIAIDIVANREDSFRRVQFDISLTHSKNSILVNLLTLFLKELLAKIDLNSNYKGGLCSSLILETVSFYDTLLMNYLTMNIKETKKSCIYESYKIEKNTIFDNSYNYNNDSKDKDNSDVLSSFLKELNIDIKSSNITVKAYKNNNDLENKNNSNIIYIISLSFLDYLCLFIDFMKKSFPSKKYYFLNTENLNSGCIVGNKNQLSQKIIDYINKEKANKYYKTDFLSMSETYFNSNNFKSAFRLEKVVSKLYLYYKELINKAFKIKTNEDFNNFEKEFVLNSKLTDEKNKTQSNKKKNI